MPWKYECLSFSLLASLINISKNVINIDSSLRISFIKYRQLYPCIIFNGMTLYIYHLFKCISSPNCLYIPPRQECFHRHRFCRQGGLFRPPRRHTRPLQVSSRTVFYLRSTCVLGSSRSIVLIYIFNGIILINIQL